MPYADRAQRLAYSKTRYQSHPEQRATYSRDYHHKRYDNDTEFRRAMRNRYLLSNYGITIERYEAMRVEQNNRCGICHTEFTDNPHTDHDHVTGQVRQLLCGHCNKGLGHFKDDPELLRSAAAYLERYK